MTSRAVTVHLPEPLYHKLSQRAARSSRTVEDETLEVLAAAVPVTEELSPDLVEAVAPLALLDDAALWRAARSHLAAEAAAELEELHGKRQREVLTDAETQTAAALVRQYERAMLIRAQAAALLKQRGHDVTQLLSSP
jgi:plasmid stability protein